MMFGLLLVLKMREMHGNNEICAFHVWRLLGAHSIIKRIQSVR